MTALAERANALSNQLFQRFAAVLRPGVEVHDLSLIFELVAAIKLRDHDRNVQLRERYLTAILDGVRAENHEPLPGPPPDWREINERWYAG
jgi:hypothetical protein